MAQKFKVNTLVLSGSAVTATGSSLYVNGQIISADTSALATIANLQSTGISLKSSMDLVSGEIITTGQTLYRYVTDISGNLDSRLYQTGSNLLALIGASAAGVSSISVTGHAVQSGSINFTGAGNVVVHTGINNIIIFSGDTSSLATIINLGSTGSTLYNYIIGLSGVVTGNDIRFQATGSNLYNLINNFSGVFNSSGSQYQSQINTLTTNLTTTGINLGVTINSLSGWVNNVPRISAINVTGFGNQTGIISISGLGTITTYTGAGNFIYISGSSQGVTTDHGDGINLSGNLTVTGQTLYLYITNTSGNLDTRLYQTGSNLYNYLLGLSGIVTGNNINLQATGSNLYNLINNFSGVFNASGVQYQNQINTIIANLTTTGVNLGLKIDALSGFVKNTSIGVTGDTPFTGRINISGIGTVTVLTGGANIIYVSGSSAASADHGDGINLSGNLTITGQTLYNYITNTSGNLTTSLYQTGSNLYNYIISTSGRLPFYIVNDYSSFSSAISTLGIKTGTLVIPNLVSVISGANVTVPPNIDLMFTNSGVINIETGAFLSIEGNIIAPNRKIFGNAATGQGVLYFGNNRSINRYVLPWWGPPNDYSSDAQPYIQSAISGIPMYCTLYAPPHQDYRINSTIIIDHKERFTFECDKEACNIKWYGPSGGTMIFMNVASNVKIGGWILTAGRTVSGAGKCIDIDGQDGGASTANTIMDTIIDGSLNTGFKGISISQVATNNNEFMKIIRNDLGGCGRSGYGIFFGASSNAHGHILEGNNFTYFNHGLHLDHGSFQTEKLNSFFSNNYDVYINNSAFPITLRGTNTEASDKYLYTNSSSAPVMVEHCRIDATGLSGQGLVEFGPVANRIKFQHNGFGAIGDDVFVYDLSQANPSIINLVSENNRFLNNIDISRVFHGLSMSGGNNSVSYNEIFTSHDPSIKSRTERSVVSYNIDSYSDEKIFVKTLVSGQLNNFWAGLAKFSGLKNVSQEIDVNCIQPSFSKKFLININTDDINTWKEVLPISSSGPKNGDFALDFGGYLVTTDGHYSLRLRSLGITDGESTQFYIKIKNFFNEGGNFVSLLDTTGIETDTLDFIRSSVLTQEQGKVGIGLRTPVYKVHISGGDLVMADGGIYVSGTSVITGGPYYLNSNPSGFLISSLTGQFYPASNTSGFITTGQTGGFGGGGVSTIINAITGAGTINYIPKFVSASGLNDSTIYDNNGLIGVGTINPTSKLHVNYTNDGNGLTVSSTAPSNFFLNTASLVPGSANSRNWALSQDGFDWGTFEIISSNTGGTDINAYLSGTTRLLIDRNGRVGINNRNPFSDARLDVSGNIYADDIYMRGHLVSTGNTSVPINLENSVFVSISGDDTLGLRGRFDKPFSTLSGGFYAAQSGDTLFTYPGNYIINNPLLIQKNVSFNFLGKGNVVSTGVIFSDKTATNSYVIDIFAPGWTFDSQDSTCAEFNIFGAGKQIYFSFDTLRSNGTCVDVYAGRPTNVILEGRKIFSTGGTPLLASAGNITIRGCEVITSTVTNNDVVLVGGPAQFIAENCRLYASGGINGTDCVGADGGKIILRNCSIVSEGSDAITLRLNCNASIWDCDITGYSHAINAADTSITTLFSSRVIGPVSKGNNATIEYYGFDSLSGWVNSTSRVSSFSVTGFSPAFTGAIGLSGLGSVTVLTGVNNFIYFSGSSVGVVTDHGDGINLSGNLQSTGQNILSILNTTTGYMNTNPSGFATISNLYSTGSTLYNYTINLSGVVTGDIINLSTTGSVLYNLINNFSGVFNSSGSQYQSQLNTLTTNLGSTGSTLNNFINTLNTATGYINTNPSGYVTTAANVGYALSSGLFRSETAANVLQFNSLLTGTGIIFTGDSGSLTIHTRLHEQSGINVSGSLAVTANTYLSVASGNYPPGGWLFLGNVTVLGPGMVKFVVNTRLWDNVSAGQTYYVGQGMSFLTSGSPNNLCIVSVPFVQFVNLTGASNLVSLSCTASANSTVMAIPSGNLVAGTPSGTMTYMRGIRLY